MSVDIYLKGKDTSGYELVRHEDIEVLVAPDMARWSSRVRLDTKGALFWRGFDVAVEHEHGPT